MSKRRKPTKAEQKVKAAKRQTAASPVAATGGVTAKTVSFAQLRQTIGDKKIVLHIGCGAPNPNKLHASFRGDDWFELRLDIDPSVKPHIIADICDLSMIPDKAVDAVWSSHNIEHLYPHQVPIALAEIYRVIKPRGHFLVTLPDIETVANYVANGKLEEPIYDSPAGPICPIDIMYGLRTSMAKGNLFMAHKTAFTAMTLCNHLRQVGFTNMKVQRRWVDLWAIAYRYEMGDPLRDERIEVATDNERGLTPPKPLPVGRTPHPGTIQQGMLTDELDVPPMVAIAPLKKSG